MNLLEICSIVALAVVSVIAIVVWTLVGIEYRKVLKQRKIDRLIERIRERAEDSGNESEGDAEELSTLMEVGNYALLDDDNV
uniref:Protein Vpu n=2 Tax=Human immunodeficiency virus type 1 TaxID=11676 RepID=M4GPM3_HV1|nr:vpu protein [Human immunodeficiency virus 1]AFD92164.1 vpu protein [Human immunodeficiency virus 1]AFD92169.1 vpu protein [Human immunodeficiency virus 1]